MLERLQEQQAAIAAVLVDDRSHRHLIPDVHEWVLIEELITILKPFQLATEIMSASKYSTVSMLRPFLIKLLNHTLKHDENDTSDLRAIKEAVATDLYAPITHYVQFRLFLILQLTWILDTRNYHTYLK